MSFEEDFFSYPKKQQKETLSVLLKMFSTFRDIVKGIKNDTREISYILSDNSIPAGTKQTLMKKASAARHNKIIELEKIIDQAQYFLEPVELEDLRKKKMQMVKMGK